MLEMGAPLTGPTTPSGPVTVLEDLLHRERRGHVAAQYSDKLDAGSIKLSENKCCRVLVPWAQNKDGTTYEQPDRPGTDPAVPPPLTRNQATHTASAIAWFLDWCESYNIDMQRFYEEAQFAPMESNLQQALGVLEPTDKGRGFEV